MIKPISLIGLTQFFPFQWT